MSIDFGKLAVTEKATGNSVDAVVSINGQEVSIKFAFDTEKARLTKTGKEYFINASGKTAVKIGGRDCSIRFQGNLFIK
jgi:hypothetical protein